MESLLNTTQVAEILGVKPATVIQWRWAGKGPKYIKTARKVLYYEHELKAWIDDHVVDPMKKEN